MRIVGTRELLIIAFFFSNLPLGFASPTAYFVKSEDWIFNQSFPANGDRTIYSYTANVPLASDPANLSFFAVLTSAPLFFKQDGHETINFLLPPSFGSDNSSYGFSTFKSVSTTSALSFFIFSASPELVRCHDGSRTFTLNFGYTFVSTTSQVTCVNQSTSGQSASISVLDIRYGAPEKYELRITYEGSNVPPDPVTIEPSSYPHPENGCRDVNLAVRKSIRVQCFDSTLEKPSIACAYIVEFPNNLHMTERSGHDHGSYVLPYGRTAITAHDQWTNVPLEGASVIYEAPEFSGEVDLRISGRASLHAEGGVVAQEIAPTTIHFQIRNQDSFAWGDLANSSLLVILGADASPSHTTGYYGTKDMQASTKAMSTTFRSALVDEKQIPILRSQAASLPWGGIYDIDENYSPPHCGHRDGRTIDIGLIGFKNGIPTTLNRKELEALKDSILNNDMGFNYVKESPTCTENPDLQECLDKHGYAKAPNHWHVVLKQ